MATWKKVIVSGSQAELAGVTGSFTGSFTGDGSNLTGISADSLANALTDGTGIADFTFNGSSAVQISTDDSAIVHDNLSGFVANEHIDHSSVSVTAGAGLTGGGTITETRTINVDSGSMNAFFSSSAFSQVNGDGTINSEGDFTLGTVGANHITEISNLTAGEGAQLENIDSVTISNTQWGYVGAMNQGVTTTSNVNFGHISASGGISASHLKINSDAEGSFIELENGTFGAKIVTSGSDYLVITSSGNSGGFYYDVRDNHLGIGRLPHITNSTGLTVGGLTSGSTLHMSSHISASGNILALGTVTASAFVGDGSGLTGVTATPEIDGLSALGGTGLHQTQDHFLFSDNGTEKKITFSNLEDAIFGNISGDIQLAAGGAATIQANAVEGSMLNTNTADTSTIEVSSNTLSVLKVPNALTAGAGLNNGGGTFDGAATRTFSVDSGSLVAYYSSSIFSTLSGDISVTDKGVATVTGAVTNAALTDGTGIADFTFDGSGAVQISTDDSAIVHDDLSGFVANEHIDHSGVSITAGAGLTGGGTIAATRTLNVDSGSMNAFFSSSAFSQVSGDATIASTGVLTLGTVGANHITEISNLTAGEGAQLENINSVTISNTQWGYVGALDQSLTTTSNVDFNNVSVAGNLDVQGTVTTLNTTNLNVEDQFLLLNSGSNSKDVGIVFGGTGGTSQQGKALVWDYSYKSNDGRLAISTTDVAWNATANFGAGTAGYYVGGVFLGSEADAATAKADHSGNIRVESDEIYIYVE